MNNAVHVCQWISCVEIVFVNIVMYKLYLIRNSIHIKYW